MTDPTPAPSPGPGSGQPQRRPLTTDEKLLAAGAGLVGLLCFLPWVSVSLGGEFGKMMEGMGEMMGGKASFNVSANAFGSTEGTLIFVLALATAGLVVGPAQGLFQLKPPLAVLLPLATSGLALVLALILFGRGSGAAPGVSAGRTLWFYLALLALGFSVYQAFKRWQAAAAK